MAKRVEKDSMGDIGASTDSHACICILQRAAACSPVKRGNRRIDSMKLLYTYHVTEVAQDVYWGAQTERSLHHFKCVYDPALSE